MKKFKKLFYLSFILAIAGVIKPAIAQTYSYQIVLRSSAVTTKSGNITATGSAFHQLTWNKTGTVSACSVRVDSSADNITWGTGDIIAAQTCTSNGQTISGSIVPNYVRINITSFTGTGALAAVLDGYVNNPTGGGSSSTVGGIAFPSTGATVPSGTINADSCPAGDPVVGWTQLATGNYQTQFSIDETTSHTASIGKLNLGCWGLDINDSGARPTAGNNNFINIFHVWGNGGVQASGTNGAAVSIFSRNTGTQQNFGGTGQLVNLYSEIVLTGNTMTPPAGPEPAFSALRGTVADERTGGIAGTLPSAGMGSISTNTELSTPVGYGSCSSGGCFWAVQASVNAASATGNHSSDIIEGVDVRGNFGASSATALGYAGVHVWGPTGGLRFPFLNYGVYIEDFGTNANDYGLRINGVNASGTPSGFNTLVGPTVFGTIAHAGAGIQVDVQGGALRYLTLKTATNCAASGTAANPSVVSCSAAPAGAVYCDVAASNGTCTVNTTAVTANSRIFITMNTADNTELSKTCNVSPSIIPAVFYASKVSNTSFTINMPTIVTNGACFEYTIVN